MILAVFPGISPTVGIDLGQGQAKLPCHDHTKQLSKDPSKAVYILIPDRANSARLASLVVPFHQSTLGNGPPPGMTEEYAAPFPLAGNRRFRREWPVPVVFPSRGCHNSRCCHAMLDQPV